MSFNQNRVDTFDKGLITRFRDESIPEGSASASKNFISKGDRIEIVGGISTLGDSQGVTPVSSYYIGIDSDGVPKHFKKVGTVLYYYNASTDTWQSILTGLPTTDLYGSVYRSPAGSFLVLSSEDSGLYRINLANPTSVKDLYDVSKNFKGVPLVKNARMWMWDTGSSGFQPAPRGILRLSKIDKDFPYTSVSGESLGGSSGTLANELISARSLSIQDSVETFVDNGNGVLIGDNGGSGTINYTTGAYSVTWGGGSPSGPITADYLYERPAANNGIFDFTYSSPNRTAGQGSFFFQGEGNSEIQGIAAIDEKLYVLHDRAIWVVELPADDLNPTNKVYRLNTGCVTKRAYVESGDGIYYLDGAGDSPKLRLLRYDRTGARLIPEEISVQLDMTKYNFDDCAMHQYGEFIMVACKELGVNYNNVILIFNRDFKLFDTYYAPVRFFAEANGELYGASSLNADVVKLFDGNTFDEADFEASWASNDSIDDTLELKRTRFLIVEGDLALQQELVVEVAYDEGEFTEVGRVSGNDPQIVGSSRLLYGVGGLYGQGLYGQGASISAGYFMKQFKLQSPKYFRRRIRFRAIKSGFASIRAYTTKDIRLLRARIPAKFR